MSPRSGPLDRMMAGLPRATFFPAATFVFLGMAASVVLRSFGDALFLDLAGLKRLPLLLVVSATALAAASAGYSWALTRMAPARVDRAVLMTFAAVSLGPVFLTVRTATAAFAWALVLGVVGPLANIIAWSWASAAIDSRTAKRAMPLLGAAATAGAVLFGALIAPFVRVAGTGMLPLAAVAIYAAMAALPRLIDHRGAVVTAPSDAVAAAPPPTLSAEARALVSALVVYALLESLAAAVADFQLKAAVQSAGGRDRIAVVLGMFYGATSAGVLLLQVALVGPVLARLGIQVGLFLNPALMLLGTVGIFSAPSVPALAAGPKLADSLLKFSFGRSALEVAMVPLGDMARRKAKVLVRGLPGPLGNLLAGAFLLLIGAAGSGAGSPWVKAAILGGPIIVIWIVASRWVLRAYLAALRSGLRIRRVDLLAQPIGGGTLERGAQDGLVEMVLHASPADAAFAREILVDGLSEREAERLDRHADPRLRRIAWTALGAMHAPRRKLDVARGRREGDDGVRAAILQAFGRRKDDRLQDEAALWSGSAVGELSREARVYLGTVGRLGRDELASVARELLTNDGRRAGMLLRAAVGRAVLSDADALALIADSGGTTRDATSTADGAGTSPGARPRYDGQALRALVALASPPALREVLQQADGPDPAAAARAFVDSPAEVGDLLGVELRGTSTAVRERVARALGAAPEVAAKLGATLLIDPEPAVRAAAARSLMRLRRAVAGVRPSQEAVASAVRMEIALGLAYRRALAHLEGRSDPAAVFARAEIAIRLTRVAERLFQLLALGGDARTLQAALRRFASGQEDARRAVLTLLEDLPSTPLRAEVVAYLEARLTGPDDGDSALQGDAFLASCLRDDATLRELRPRIEALRATTLFTGLGGDVLADLAAASDEMDVSGGSVVVRQGEPGDALFAVMMGEMRFEKDGRTVGRARAGQAFGELSVIDGAPRGATAVCETVAKLLRVRRAAVHGAMERHPDLWQGVARSLARWIREARPA